MKLSWYNEPSKLGQTDLVFYLRSEFISRTVHTLRKWHMHMSNTDTCMYNNTTTTNTAKLVHTR